MKKLNPAIKLISLMILTFELAFFKNYILNFAVFAFCIVYVLITGNFKKCIPLLIPIFLAAFGMFFAGYRYSAQGVGPVNENMILLSDTEVFNGLILSSRVLAFAGVLFLFSFTTDRMNLIKSLHKQLRLPAVFAYSISAAYGVFPYVIKELKQTKTAFRLRGIRVMTVSPKLLKPILVKATRWSEMLSLAMESKGFDSDAVRTCFQPCRVKWYDFAFGVICLIIPVSLNFLLK